MKHLLLVASLLLSTQLVRAAEPVSAPEANGFSGKVLETTNTAGYTYLLVDTGSKKVWAAASQIAVKPGDHVNVGPGMPMSNYHSKSLNRDFDTVYFVGNVMVGGAQASAAATPALPSGHPAVNDGTPNMPPGHAAFMNQKPAAKVDLTGIKRAEGGNAIAEIYAESATLSGKTVTVRGKVVKYNASIMGKNWLHIRDGSGTDDKKNNDLTVTTSVTTKVGATVLVTGKISVNRDFGAGYKYSVIIEDAKVMVE